MKVDKYKVIGELIETNKRQFVIPVYQRNYDWKPENCKKLFDDVVLAASKQKNHFLGSIVYVDMGEEEKIYRYLVIDGQQRITTIFLFLKALHDISITDSTKEKIKDIIFNEDKYNDLGLTEQSKMKLKPIKSDNEQLLHLLKDEYEEMDKNSQVYINYEYLKKMAKAKIEGSSITCDDILDGLKQLSSAVIVLKEEDGDEPQIIFESINSTGVPLSLSDLIRNYVLMTEPKQDELFENYWQKIESNVGINKMTSFIIDYLTIKCTEQVGLKSAYELFRKYKENSSLSNEEILKELLHYSKYYKAFLTDTSEYSDVIKSRLMGLRIIEQTTVYPFLFQVFDDYHNEQISEEILEDVVTFLFIYHLRRVVCEVPSNSFKGLYKTLYNRLYSKNEAKSNYYDTLVQFLSSIKTKDTLPTEDEFKDALLSKNLYQKKNVCKYILKLIEETETNGEENKEKLIFNELSIEHVMPQKLTDEWKTELGSECESTHAKYLHTLGNLTLTGYNSELGTKSFEEKKETLSQHNTRMVVLNEEIMSSNNWTETEIKQRAQTLCNKVLSIFKIKPVQSTVNVNLDSTMVSMFTEDLSNTKPTMFELFGESIEVDSYSKILKEVINILYVKDDVLFNKMADENYSIPSATRRTYITRSSNILTRPFEVQNTGIYVESNLSANNIASFINSLFNIYGIDDTDFSLWIEHETVEISAEIN